MEGKRRQTTYVLNWVVGTDRKGTLVLTNSSLPVIPSKHTSVPCHDSHTPLIFSAKMDTLISGNDEVVNLRLTSCGFDGEIVILVKFNESFLDLFIGETEVVFPFPFEKPIVCGMTMSGDDIVLTNSSLPVVEKIVITGEIPMEKIQHTLPSSTPLDEWIKGLSLSMESKTPCFVKTTHGSTYCYSLPDECLTSIPCHEGLVPVKCSAKLDWFSTLGSKISFVLLLSSKWLETPIYVQIDTNSSFLDLFSGCKTTEVFFPLPIPKSRFLVEVKNIYNFKFKSLKGESGATKKSEREEKEERIERGAIGHDCDSDKPLPTTHDVERPNQCWSIYFNSWELIRKPKPRDRDWKWNDFTASWECELDPTTGLLKEFDRTHYSNCWPKLPTTQQSIFD